MQSILYARAFPPRCPWGLLVMPPHENDNVVDATGSAFGYAGQAASNHGTQQVDQLTSGPIHGSFAAWYTLRGVRASGRSRNAGPGGPRIFAVASYVTVCKLMQVNPLLSVAILETRGKHVIGESTYL